LVTWLGLRPDDPASRSNGSSRCSSSACPHALGLAIPLGHRDLDDARAPGVGSSLRGPAGPRGGAEGDAVVFDKTGTLTARRAARGGNRDGAGHDTGRGAATRGRRRARFRAPRGARAPGQRAGPPTDRSALVGVRVPPRSRRARVVDGRTLAAGGPNLLQEMAVTRSPRCTPPRSRPRSRARGDLPR
jgi:hypothetical protein